MSLRVRELYDILYIRECLTGASLTKNMLDGREVTC